MLTKLGLKRPAAGIATTIGSWNMDRLQKQDIKGAMAVNQIPEPFDARNGTVSIVTGPSPFNDRQFLSLQEAPGEAAASSYQVELDSSGAYRLRDRAGYGIDAHRAFGGGPAPRLVHSDRSRVCTRCHGCLAGRRCSDP